MRLVPKEDPRTKDMFVAIEGAIQAQEEFLRGDIIARLRNIIFLDAINAVGLDHNDLKIMEDVRIKVAQITSTSELSTNTRSVLEQNIISAIVACREQYRRCTQAMSV